MAETKPWPRAQRMSFVVAGERAQPHHYQAIAEYDEARGEATPHGGKTVIFTAAQVNQAIEWWNKRAVLEEQLPGPDTPLTDAELAELAASIEHLSGPDAWDQDRLEPALIPVTHYVPRLLAELKRSRKEPRAACYLCTAPLGITVCTDCAEALADEGKRRAAHDPIEHPKSR